MIYELREYRAKPDTIDRLHQRFESDTVRVFERHGIEMVGAWTSEEEPTRLLYLTRFPTEDARVRAWEAFGQDPEWQAVKAESERDGPLMVSQESTVLHATAYSPLR